MQPDSPPVDDAARALDRVWRDAAMPADALPWLALSGTEPALPSSFRVGTIAQASIGLAALAAAALWRQRTGRAQQVAVDMRHAAVEFRSERYVAIDGAPAPPEWDSIAGLYRTGDGGWVRLHTNFPRHRAGVLTLLGCPGERAAVQAALDGWNARAFEDAAAAAGLCVTALRSFAEWDAGEQGRALAALPLVEITRLGDAPARPLPAGNRPLAGVRVLELTRIIAGPVAGRTLAAHGADVLLVSGPKLPAIPALVIDTGRGKLSAFLDLDEAPHRARLSTLLAEADVFLQSYRPGAVAVRGFGPEDCAAIRPGIVYGSLSAYGRAGPWAARRGFDSLVQTASGFNDAEAAAAGSATPKPLPAQALDHASGYLLAFGIMAALHRRATEGGSWHVQVSLARTGRWLRELGRIDGFGSPELDAVAFLETTPSGFGELTAVRHAASLSATPAQWARPAVPLGTDPPAWPSV
jgi:crotonobetainyl-CoA:carnitine CoA-transferase CaiB-like acyl-CoA transferase